MDEKINRALNDLVRAANSLEDAIDLFPPKYRGKARELLNRMDHLLEKWSG